MTAGAKVPPLITPGRIAKASGVSYKTVCTDLRNAGLLVRRGSSRRARFKVSASALRELLEDYYQAVYDDIVLNENSSAD